ncbi:MAG: hypothetical protein AABZ83_00425 [candidate division NC10 bacterium]
MVEAGILTKDDRVEHHRIASPGDGAGPDPASRVPRPDFYTTGQPEPDDILLAVEVMDTSVEKDRLTVADLLG